MQEISVDDIMTAPGLESLLSKLVEAATPILAEKGAAAIRPAVLDSSVGMANAFRQATMYATSLLAASVLAMRASDDEIKVTQMDGPSNRLRVTVGPASGRVVGYITITWDDTLAESTDETFRLGVSLELTSEAMKAMADSFYVGEKVELPPALPETSIN